MEVSRPEAAQWGVSGQAWADAHWLTSTERQTGDCHKKPSLIAQERANFGQ
jgi:hypothetical protein